MSFDQQRLDSAISVGEEELQQSRTKIQELETQLVYYKKTYAEDQQKITLQQNSLQSFARDQIKLKEQLGLAELRNQELKEENVKQKAQLSNRIELLLNERQAFMTEREQEFWADVPQFSLIASYKKLYNKLRVRVDLENHVIMTAMPYEPISAANA